MCAKAVNTKGVAASEKKKKKKISPEKSLEYRTRKRIQRRMLEETKPGIVLKDNPDYKKIIEIVKKGG